jgi:hypothetical protein
MEELPVRLAPGLHSTPDAHHVFVEAEEGLGQVAVHDLGLPLEEPLLEEEGCHLPDLVVVVVQRLKDPEEEQAVDLQVVLLKENFF